MSRRGLVAAAATIALPLRARAQSRRVIKIGVLNDMSGPYRDSTGMGSAVCLRHALREFNVAGLDVQVLTADHQNKPDVGVSVVRQWIDRDRVDVIMDVPTSSVALAVGSIAREKNILYINTGGGTGDLTGSQCTPVTVHWGYDTFMLARSTATQVTKVGGNKWFFVTADYVFGQQLARDAIRFAKQDGGQVLGEQRYPFPGTTDFSALLVSAQASGANVIGFANAGDDTSNCIKQAHEFGLMKTMKIAALLMQVTDVQAVGTDIGGGIYLTTTFYWDANEGTRRLTSAVQDAMPDRTPPSLIQAACYAGGLHYMKALTALGADRAHDGAAVCAQMKAMPTADSAFGKNRIRNDGLCLLPAYLYQIKTTAESHGKWDLQKLVATTPADEAWKPLSEEGCTLAPA
jgi:branched-chain amino acid transport system substrate-binding protein